MLQHSLYEEKMSNCIESINTIHILLTCGLSVNKTNFIFTCSSRSSEYHVPFIKTNYTAIHVDVTSFILSCTQSAEKTGHIKYIIQFIEKGKKRKGYSESKLVKFCLQWIYEEPKRTEINHFGSYWTNFFNSVLRATYNFFKSINNQTANSWKHKWAQSCVYVRRFSSKMFCI